MPETEIIKVDGASDSISNVLTGKTKNKYGRFEFAALGSIPWIGGVLAASSALNAELEQGRVNEMAERWLDEHREKINLLENCIQEIANRLESFQGAVFSVFNNLNNTEEETMNINGLKYVFVIIILPAVLISCWTSSGIFKKMSDDDLKIIATSADIRTIQKIIPKEGSKHGKIEPKFIMCAEPSPDIAKAVSEAFAASTDLAVRGLPSGIEPKVAAAISRSHAQGIAQLTERLATIQLLRDTLYRACEAYANGAITKTSYTIMLSRYDDIMITMLLGEFAAGAFGRSLASIGMEAGGNASALLEIQEKRERKSDVEKNLKLIQKEQRDAEAALEAEKKKGEASDEQTINKLEKELEAKNKEVEEAKDELIDKLEAESETTAKALNVIAGGGITTRQDKEVAATLASMQRKYIENINSDALDVACITALEDSSGEGNELITFCKDHLKESKDIKSKLLDKILERSYRDRDIKTRKEEFLQTIKEVQEYLDEFEKILNSAQKMAAAKKK